MGGCQAISQSDGSVLCVSCGLSWDSNDRDVPECGERMLARKEISERLKALRCQVCNVTDRGGRCPTGVENGCPCYPEE